MHALNLRTQWISFIFDVRVQQQMENPNVSLLHDEMWLICLSNAQRLDNPVLRHVRVTYRLVLCKNKNIMPNRKKPQSTSFTESHLKQFLPVSCKRLMGYCRHPGRCREYTSL